MSILSLALALPTTVAPSAWSAPVDETPALARGRLHALLPRGVTSFGAAVAGDWLFVLGGYHGTPHDYSREGQCGDALAFSLLDVRDQRALPSVEPLQSVALVAHEGVVVRVGGMRARNGADEAADLVSVAEVARLRPFARDIDGAPLDWEPLPPLPEPRSSHDAVVVGDHLVVVGGWTMGDAGRAWAEDALVLDLAAEGAAWESIPAPFQARALAAAPFEGGLVVVGGLSPQRSEGALNAVHVLDLEARTWRSGPDFPGPGFGVAAARVGDAVVASGSDGRIHRWDPRTEGAGWVPVGALAQPRFFHRLVPAPDGGVFAVGGIAGMDRSDRIRSIEHVAFRELERGGAGTPVEGPIGAHIDGPIDAPLGAAGSDSVSRQGAWVVGTSLFLAGGNRAPGQHDFGPECFAAASRRFDLGSLATEALAPFPAPRQSMQAAHVDGVTLVGGGFGHDGEVARSFAETYVYEHEFDSWIPGPRLDRPRSQFAMLTWGGDVWALGGHDYDPRRVDDEAFLYPRAVVVCDPRDRGAAFEDSGLRLPRGRRAFACAELDGRAYLVGGMGPGFRTVDEVDVVDLGSGAWSTVSSPRTQRVGAKLVALEGRLYLVGGSLLAEHDRARPARSVEVFDPATGSWHTHVEDLGVELRHVEAAAVGGRLLVWSTHDPGHARIRCLFVDPVAAR